MKKTNAMRLLDQNKLNYEIIEYDLKDGNIDGISVANKIGYQAHEVFKTLVLIGQSKKYYVAMIPVDKNLNLKSVSKHFGEKKVEMIHVKDILKITGYIRGGCSPLAMKKNFDTVVDSTVEAIDEIIFSAGKQGMQIKMKPHDLIKVLNCKVSNIVE